MIFDLKNFFVRNYQSNWGPTVNRVVEKLRKKFFKKFLAQKKTKFFIKSYKIKIWQKRVKGLTE